VIATTSVVVFIWRVHLHMLTGFTKHAFICKASTQSRGEQLAAAAGGYHWSLSFEGGLDGVFDGLLFGVSVNEAVAILFGVGQLVWRASDLYLEEAGHAGRSFATHLDLVTKDALQIRLDLSVSGCVTSGTAVDDVDFENHRELDK